MISVSSSYTGFSAGGKGYLSPAPLLKDPIRVALCARRTAATRLQVGKACLDSETGGKDDDDGGDDDDDDISSFIWS